ncbi:MAG: DUF4159 domain-containing protein [bacterium]
MQRFCKQLPGVLVLACLPAFVHAQESAPAADNQNGAAHMPSAQGFTFVRIQWAGEGYGIFARGNGPLWAHDYPTAEQNFYTALHALTAVPMTFENKILTLADDAIFSYPLLYICEVGYWLPAQMETERLQEYLKRGGFLIVDDFRGGFEWRNFYDQIQRFMPEPPLPLSLDHPVFHCFFDFEHVGEHAPYGGLTPVFYGLYDQKKRLIGIVNYNNDIGDGWEWPEDYREFSTEAFKLGINYLIYAMTH